MVLLVILLISLKNTCVRASSVLKLQAETCNFINKETLAQVFFSEFCNIFRNTFFFKTPSNDCFYLTISIIDVWQGSKYASKSVYLINCFINLFIVYWLVFASFYLPIFIYPLIYLYIYLFNYLLIYIFIVLSIQ